MAEVAVIGSIPRNVSLVHILGNQGLPKMRGMARNELLARIRRERISELIELRFEGKNVAFSLAIGKSPSQVGHWLSGHRNPNGDTCREVEDSLNLPKGWLDGADEAQLPLAHALSERQPILLPSTLVWEDMVIEDVTGQFILVIVGDALAPDYLPGQAGIWEAGSEGRAGKPVLLADQRDEIYLRLYQPRAGGSWAGVSQRVGHRELTPEADGVRVIARLRYLDLG